MTAALAGTPIPPALTPVLRLVAADRPDANLSTDELGSRIVALAGRLAAATCRWLLLVAEFDARAGHERMGLASTARWLSHCCGIAHRTAVDHVRVARALAGFPALAAAMSAGRLSYSHVRAIARVARMDEQHLVADLIEVAEHGTVGQLETVVRGLRTVDDNAAAEPDGGATPPDEYVRWSWTSQSQWRMHTRLAPERGAIVQAAVERIAAAEAITCAEALVRLAEIGLAAVADASDAPRPMRGDERAAVVIHLDAAAVTVPDDVGTDGTRGEARSPEHGPGDGSDAVPTGDAPNPAAVLRAAATRARRRRGVSAHITGGPGLPRRVMERLLCAGRIRPVVRNADGGALNLGRTSRVVSGRQFAALMVRDGGCAHPGCGSHNRLEAHHVQHWLYGGPTDLGNLVLLCERHHHGHHAGEFVIIAAGGTFRFVRADGRVLPTRVDPSVLIGPDEPLEPEADGGGVERAFTNRTGERLDRDYAVAVLATRRAARCRVQVRPGTTDPLH